MVNIHTDRHISCTASEISTDELLRNVGRFPYGVLPTGVLRELRSRGAEIHDSLVRLLSKAIDLRHEGFKSESNSVFFAFVLLTPIATSKDRSLIGSLLSLPDKSVNDLISDLRIEALPHLIANFFQDGDASETIDWMNRLSDTTNETHFDSYSIYPALKVAVKKGYLDRATAIDTLVKQLKKRADERYDPQSTMIVFELIDLSARSLEAVDAVVQASFANEQIDLDFIDVESWNTSDLQGKNPTVERTWDDPAAELSSWNYRSVSDDLDPLNATLRANQVWNRQSSIEVSALQEWIDQLRKSTDQDLPLNALKSLQRHVAYTSHATMILIREEMARYEEQNDADSWIGNGAYLGLVLAVVSQLPLPTDVMQTILRMPQSDRERIFGDQFGLIVQAIALTPWKQLDFVEQWIWGTERSDPDRREMVDVYLFAYYKELMGREKAVETLVEGLQRALEEDPVLIAPYATNLAFFTPQEHSQLLEKAFQRDDTDWFYSLPDLQRLATDADFAKTSQKESLLYYRELSEIIGQGVMFDQTFVGKKRGNNNPVARVDSAEPKTPIVKMIRNEPRTSRNDKCPCGSGKKFKKCCLYKPAT